MRMGIWELGVVLAIVVLLFGAKRLPALADGMGKAIRNFKREIGRQDEPEIEVEDHILEAESSAVPLAPVAVSTVAVGKG